MMSKSKEIIIGVDAGGTTSKVALFELDGTILAKSFGKSGSPAVTKEWYLHIDDAIDDTLNKINKEENKIVFIQLGVSGISALTSYEEIIQYFTNKYQSPCAITSDTMSALYSVLDDEEQAGIVVISGTGVGIFGKNNQNQTMLIGGWGHLLREYGSAYAIVHRFCVRLIDRFESTGTISSLGKKFLQKNKLNNIRDLNHLFYQNSKDEIASLSTFFKEEANQGNKSAILALREQGRLLGKQVSQLMKFLHLPNGTKIGLRGGFLEKDGKYIIQGIKEFFEQNNIILHFEKKATDQLYGVYRMALNHMKKGV